MRLKLLASSFIVGLSLAPLSDAHAIEVVHTDFGSAVAACQGALPAYEGTLRKRPLAMQNEGAAPAFVNCAFPVENLLWRFEVSLRSMSGSAASVSCTAVNGYDGGEPRYATKTVVLAADGSPASLIWRPADFGGADTFPIMQVSLSCVLPRGASLGRTWTDTTRYIGN